MKHRIGLSTSVAVVALALSCAGGYAATCSAYPTGTADKIESKDVEAKFGAIPAPSKELHFAYVTKTLINEFWQDVASGIQKEASKYKVKVDIQAAKDEFFALRTIELPAVCTDSASDKWHPAQVDVFAA